MTMMGQTNPGAVYSLSTGSWTLTGWSASNSAGTYPSNGSTGSNTTTGVAANSTNANMMFWKHGSTDPVLSTAQSANMNSNYSAGSGKVVGNGTNGFYFDNTGGAGIGSAVLSVNTTGRTSVQVAWTGRRIATGARPYVIRLMYRVGNSGAFVDANATASTITFTPSVATQTFSTTLPADAENKAEVQIMWRFYQTDNTTTGTRPQLGVDEITVSSTAASTTPAVTASAASLTGFTYIVGAGPSATQNFTVSGSNLTADLTVSPTTTDYEISSISSGPYTSLLTFTPSSGTVGNQTIYVRLKSGLTVNSYSGSVEVKSTGATTKTVTLSGSVSNPAPTAAITGTLTETTLNGGTIVVTIANDTFAASLSPSNFALTGAPTGTTIASVTRDSATQATLTLAYVTTNDFDSNATMGVTVQAGALVTNTTTSVAAGNTLTITAVNEALTLAPTSLTGLNYTAGSGPSAAQSFTVSSANLSPTSNTVTITAPTNFEVSATSATTGFGASATLTYSGNGTFANNTVWVRLKSGLSVNSYTGTVTVAGGKASGSLSVSGAVAVAPPANDNCTGAIALTINASNITGTFEGATQSIAAIDCAGSTGNADEDVWYKFTTTTAGNYRIVADGGDPLDLVLDLRSGACDGTNIACADTIDNIEYLTSTLAANTTYYLRIYDYTAYSGLTAYTFTVRVEQLLDAPVATAATNITPTSFTANWNAALGASSYRLDVSTESTFGARNITESFTGTTFPPTGWTSTGWSRSASAADYNSGPAAAIANSNVGNLTSPAIANPTSVSFYLGRSNNSTAKTLYVEVSTTSQAANDFVTVATFDHNNVASASYSQYTVDLSAYTSNATVYIRFRKDAATTSPWRLDDVVFNYEVDAYVPGYKNQSFITLNEEVSGLTAGTPYYYRVRGVNGSVTSANSNTISVTTGRNNVWNGTAWTAGTPPTGTDAAIIQGNFNTGTNTGLTSVYDLTVNSGTLTIASGTTVTVTNQVKNNGGSIVAQNNGNLIQVNNVANTGNAVINRNSSPLFRQDYTMWSSPVAGQTLIGFSPNTLTNRFYTYNTTNDQFAAISASSTFEAGKGYLIRMPNGAFGTDGTTPAGTPTSTASAYQQGTDTMVFNGAFTGVPNNGNVDVTLTDALNGFNLVGNPYPSPINISTFLNANNSVIDGTVWIWRKTNSSTLGSAYVTVNAAGAYTGNGQPEAENPNSVLRQGQGFIVKVKDDNASNNITFTNAMRSSDTANQFFRNANAAAQMGAPERHGMRINLSKEGQIVSQLYAGYIEGATLGADNGIDSRYINDNANVLDMVIDGKEYIIQGRPLPFATEDIVPLNLKVAAAGTYSISLNDAEGLFANGQDIFIKDNLTGSIQNLNEGNYSFTADAGTAASRFEIVYTNSVLGTDNPSATLNNVVVYQNAAGINIAAGNLSINDVTVYDVQGRLVYTAEGVNASETVLKMQPAQQLLIIEVVTNAGKTTRKLVY